MVHGAAQNPLRLCDVTLANRLVHWPVDLDSAEDGSPANAQERQLSAGSLGPSGLTIAECAVSRDGRITPGSCGLYKEEHVTAWRRIVEQLRGGGTSVGVSLVHAGRRGSVRPRGEGLDRPLRQGNWPLLSASALPYTPHSAMPKEMSAEDMAHAAGEFVAAARSAERAGFDALLLHCAHGYLLASFLSPLSNHRADNYGGSIENRMRYPLEVFDAVRAVWPKARPLLAAIPGSDFAKGGWTPEDAVVLARILKQHGCDALVVLTGQSSYEAEPTYGPAFLNSVSDLVRNEVRIPVMNSGYIASADLANTAVAAGRADLCIIDQAN
jgi:anthraniloyl-CoA monooxygenase